MTEYRAISVDHVAGVMQICRVEGWPSFAEDGDKTWRALTAPGVTTVVALEDGVVLGFAQMQSDGVVQAHLSTIAVRRDHRASGIGKRLVEEAFARAGGVRIDLISTESSDGFYESFEHKRFPGFRIYPESPPPR